MVKMSSLYADYNYKVWKIICRGYLHWKVNNCLTQSWFAKILSGKPINIHYHIKHKILSVEDYFFQGHLCWKAQTRGSKWYTYSGPC